MLKSIIILVLPLLFFSCADKKQKETEKTTDVKSDSSDIIKSTRTVNAYSPVDVSPMDMSYFPVDFPKTKAKSTEAPFARVVYSRPHLQGRQLFHDILKYGEPWRLGANEATELDLYKPATIGGKQIQAGRYVLYCIPDTANWTIVLNSNIDSWGLHPDLSSDIEKFTVPVAQNTDRLEYFTIVFRPNASGADLVMAWENIEASLPFKF